MGLQQKRDVWKSHRKHIGFYDHCRQLTELRNGVEEYGASPVSIQRDALKRLDLAYKAFYRRVKAGETPGYPRFKSRARYDSFSLGKHDFKYECGLLHITKLGMFRTKTGFCIQGKPVVLRIKRHGKKWIAQLSCDMGEAPAKKPVVTSIGIDLGLTNLATLSDGTEIKNPRWNRREGNELAKTGRRLSAKKWGSKNRAKAKEQLRRVHQRISGKRKSYLTGIAKHLVGKYDLISHEALNIQEMIQSRMARSIMDAAWGELIWRLKCEAEKAGKWVVPVNPRNTTKACSGCGVLVSKTLAQRQHDCYDCGLSLDRDHNAALNILALGMSAVTSEAKYVRQQSM
jgi:putative transposase